MARRPQSLSVLFVCLGNICRSPTAHGVFQQQLVNAGLEARVSVDSAGTAGYHIGAPPDPRSTAAAAGRGYDLSPLRARQVVEEDFHRFDYILAMDNDNLASLKQLEPPEGRAELALFLNYAEAAPTREVPDPYYGGGQGFEQVLDLVESASIGLIDAIRLRLND